MTLTYEEKLQRAKDWLGLCWCLHPHSIYRPTWRAWK